MRKAIHYVSLSLFFILFLLIVFLHNDIIDLIEDFEVESKLIDTFD